MVTHPSQPAGPGKSIAPQPLMKRLNGRAKAPVCIGAFVLLVFGLAISGCHREPEAKPITGLPELGALYSCSDGEGGYRVAKVLVVEDEIVFVRLFRERWTQRPQLEKARRATAPIPLAYSLTTLSGMQLVPLEKGQVTAEESELYEEWKRGKREVF